MLGGQLATLEWHEELRTKVSGYSAAAAINVFDANGTLINSSEVWPVPDTNVSDRAYFKALKSGDGSTPIQIELVRGRISGSWATIVAHRLGGPKGEFAGVITRAIMPATFEKSLPPWCSGRGLRFRCTGAMKSCWRAIRMSNT